MTNSEKYAAQVKHLREKYVRFSLDMKPDELAAFRAACDKAGTKPTTEIKRFIREYVENGQ